MAGRHSTLLCLYLNDTHTHTHTHTGKETERMTQTDRYRQIRNPIEEIQKKWKGLKERKIDR